MHRGTGYQKLKLELHVRGSVLRLRLGEGSILVTHSLQTLSLLPGGEFIDEIIETSIKDRG